MPPPTILLPELLPIVISHIPLYQVPSTVLSLSIVCKPLYETLVPRILYSCIIVREEATSIDMICRLISSQELGQYVQELYIYSGLSEAVMTGKKGPFTMINGLERLIVENKIPNVHALGIYLDRSYHCNEQKVAISGEYRQLNPAFWDALSRNCPRIRDLHVSNIGFRSHASVYSYASSKKLSKVKLSMYSDEGMRVLYKGLSQMSPNLHTLEISPLCDGREIFLYHFPSLVKLFISWELRSNTEPDIPLAMEFWKKHKSIQNLHLYCDTFGGCFFPDPDVSDCPEDLFPNLVHLAASFEDVRALSFLIPQLEGLSILRSLNCQAPYLFVEVLEKQALLRLRSLIINNQIRDTIYDFEAESRPLEGACWNLPGMYESYKEATKTTMLHGLSASYISAMAEVAPNVEVLALNTVNEYIITEGSEYTMDAIADFKKLEAFYYLDYGVPGRRDPLRQLSSFIACAELLGQRCPNLRLVMDTRSGWLQFSTYRRAKIIRGVDGTVKEVVLGNGSGPTFTHADEPFLVNMFP